MQQKPFAPACERNQAVIFDAIEPYLRGQSKLLEIGSGTGQHAVYCAQRMPWLQWQTSDMQHNHSGIEMWLQEAALANALLPIALDVLNDPWPQQQFDAIFSANTAHIMPWQAVQAMFDGVAGSCLEQGVMMLYGPFNYSGKYTSESNARFDDWLKAQAPHQAIRDFEAVDQLAAKAGLKLIDDIEMPANNRVLVWQKAR